MYLIFLLAISGFLFVLYYSLTYKDSALLTLVLSGMTTLIIPIFLLLKKHIFASSWTLSLIVLFSLTLCATIGQGYRDTAIFAFPVILVFTSLTLSRKAVIINLVLMFFAISWLIFGEMFGLFVRNPDPNPFIFNFFILIFVLILIAIVIDFLTMNLKINFEQVQKELYKRKKAEEDTVRIQNQLNHNQKMEALGQLAGGIAHDFNNILSGILSATQLLQLHNKTFDSKDLNYISIISQATERATNLTRKLLSFSHVDNFATSAIDLNSILDGIVEILYNTLNKDIEISLLLKAEKHIIRGNKSAMENAFLNLGINSSHAMENGGKIRIVTENIKLNDLYCEASTFNIIPGEYCKITFSDTGSGIEPQNINKIFEPFFTTKEQGKGTGLGLSSVYGTIRDHLGEIQVSSDVGNGTSFYILIPLSIELLEERKNSVIETGHGMILLVDDEEFNRSLGKEILESLGYKVLLATNGQEAITIFEKKHTEISIVILDMIMPIMNGSKAFIKMKEIDENCKVIITSGHIKDENMNDLIDQRLAGFIKKPYTRSEISTLLSSILNIIIN